MMTEKITTTMRIIEVSLEDIDLTKDKIQVNFSEVKIHMVEVNAIKFHTKANIKTIAIKVIITKVIEVYIITHAEISNRAIIMANLEAEAMVIQYHDFNNGDVLTFKDKYTALLQWELQNMYWCLHDPITIKSYQISSEMDMETVPHAMYFFFFFFW